MIICELSNQAPGAHCYLLMMAFSKLSLAIKDDITEVKGDMLENTKAVAKLHKRQKGNATYHFVVFIIPQMLNVRFQTSRTRRS
jgi:hypothetical protein